MRYGTVPPHGTARKAVPLLFFALLAALVAACAPLREDAPHGNGLELVILHTNDTHSHIAGIDAYGNACFSPENRRGGMGRIAAAVRAAKAQSDNVIALDAGDQFQGTLFYTVNKWPMLAEIDALMPYDAMTLGNHEFDEGCGELARFLERQPIPVLAANLAPEAACPLRGSRIAPYMVKEVRGVRVGIVGLANDQVEELAEACPATRFSDAATALSEAVKELEADGVRHIVAVTHLGLPADRELARRVEGVDVIVGGHTHSYLGPDSSEGPYPVVERSPSGRPVLVATAKRATQYLGELDVSFDADGVPESWTGGPRELAATAPGDPAVDALVKKYAAPLDAYREKVIGSHNLHYADGMDACRAGDCLAGMITVDAMLEYARPFGASIALCNGGGVRAAFAPGVITRGDLLAVHPFGNMLVVREYTGEQLWQALEHGVSGEGGTGPRLLQVAGLRYTVDTGRPAGKRLLHAEVLDASGRAAPLKRTARYGVILSDFMSRGGDGYGMLADGRPLPSPDPLDIDVIEPYIRAHSPLPMPVTGRINGMGRK